MKIVRVTDEFDKWLQKLKDQKGKAIIISRITRLENGNYGDVKWFEGIGELRIPFGPAYRIYIVEQKDEIVVLLCGGNKGSQQRDIKRALQIVKDLENDG